MVRAFVVGNAVWDEALHLAALPEPGASVHMRRGAAGPGGKGANQAVVLARAGIPVRLVAPLGPDARGAALRAALATEGLAEGLIEVAAETDWTIVLVSQAGENAVLTTRDAADALDPAKVTTALAEAVPGDLCLLQGNLSLLATSAAVRAAKAAGAVVAMNPSPVDPAMEELFAEVDILCVNGSEARAFGIGDGALPATGPRQIVLTRGAAGAVLIAPDGPRLVPAVQAEVVDPTGAGDTFFAAALAHAAPRGWRLDADALAAGARAAALTVARAGAFAALPSAEELSAIMSAR